MKAGRSKKLSCFLCSVFGLTIISAGMSAVAFSFSWFHNNNYLKKDFTGNTAGAYYASGTGTESDPFIIKRPTHLYNLAWLQYLGEYNKVDSTTEKIETTYFKLSDDIDDIKGLDMGGWVLPPIGTEDNPFVCNFNGNNKIIRNLTISNNFSDFSTRHPQSVKTFDGGEIIGFFGVVGQLSTELKYTSSTNKVTNLYLDQITVKNGSTKTLAGLLAGYVNGEMTNCGVYRGKFDFISGTSKIEDIGTTTFSNVSDYSLIGSYNSTNYSWEDQPGSGDGNAYGTSTNIKSLYEDLEEISSTYTSVNSNGTLNIPKNHAFPFRRENNTIVSGSGTTNVKLYSTASSTSSVTNSSTFQGSSKGNNLGYYSGSGLKLYYKKGVDYSISNFGQPSSIGTVYFKIPSSDNEIFTYLNNKNEDGTISGDYLLRLGDSLDSYWFSDSSNYQYIQNAKVGSYSGGALIPSRCIWVAPQKAGTFKFVLYTPEKSTSIYFNELKRTTSKNYSSPFDRYHLILDPLTLSGSSLYYFEKEVTEDDINDGSEYMVAYSGSTNAPYIAYMDIGTSSADPGTTTKPAIVKNVDFVYALEDTVSKGLAKIDASGYAKSNVLFSISGTSSSQQQFYFMRLIASGVLYYNTASSGLAITPIGTGTNSSSSKSKWDDTTSN